MIRPLEIIFDTAWSATAIAALQTRQENRD
jgi:hypothetical protein